jgi:O-acetyl-ADP-ribose deacetylase (regulator of RNase III)
VARITLVEGDITAQEVDVVVNAANRSLLGGGGVDGAIHRRGGPRILAECRRVREERYPDGLPVGRAVTTTAGDLPATHVIHVVGPVYGREPDAPGLLAACHTEALRLADELGARSIAFPAISTGAYGYPLDEAATVAIRAVREPREPPTRLEEIRFVLFDAAAYEAFGRALSLAGGAASSPAGPGSG